MTEYARRNDMVQVEMAGIAQCWCQGFNIGCGKEPVDTTQRRGNIGRLLKHDDKIVQYCIEAFQSLVDPAFLQMKPVHANELQVMCLALKTSDPTETAPILGPPPNLGSFCWCILIPRRTTHQKGSE